MSEEKEEEEEIIFKEELTGLDYIMALPEESKGGFISQLRLMLVALRKPKLTYEELIAMPLEKFGKMFAKFVIKFKREQDIINTPQSPETTTYIWPRKEMPLSEIKHPDP